VLYADSDDRAGHIRELVGFFSEIRITVSERLRLQPTDRPLILRKEDKPSKHPLLTHTQDKRVYRLYLVKDNTDSWRMSRTCA